MKFNENSKHLLYFRGVNEVYLYSVNSFKKLIWSVNSYKRELSLSTKALIIQF